MSRNTRRRPGARALAVLAGVLLALTSAALPATAASEDGGDEEKKPSDGAIEVSYTETTEVRAGAGWLIDCDAINPLDGIEIACVPEGLTLRSLGFDTDLGEQVMTVPQSFGATTLTVRYRVRLERPPAPEIAFSRFDLPITVGQQALIPISALGITCDFCTAEGGATIVVDTLPAGVVAGVSETHLAVRGSTVGDAVITLVITDDAGQAVATDLTVSFVAGPSADAGSSASAAQAASAPLHLIGPLSDISLVDIVPVSDAVIVCSPAQSLGIECDADGALRGGALPAQLLFHVVGEGGALRWGSVTSGASMTVAAPSWDIEAPLSIVRVPPSAQEQPEAVPLLAGLAQLLEGIPAS